RSAASGAAACALAVTGRGITIAHADINTSKRNSFFIAVLWRTGQSLCSITTQGFSTPALSTCHEPGTEMQALSKEEGSRKMVYPISEMKSSLIRSAGVEAMSRQPNRRIAGCVIGHWD